MLQPKHLVFAGGGPKCLSFFGALEVLHKENIFNKVSHYWGTSAGAIVATFMSLKVPFPILRNIFETIDFKRFRDIDLANIVTFGEKWGMDSGDAFMNHMQELLETAKPGSSKYTLQELPGLHIAAADLTDTKIVILDGTTYPTLKLIDALRASTSIPFFYIPFRNPVNNHLLVDGGIGANFPWLLLPTDEDRNQALGFNFKKVLLTKEPESLNEYIPKILTFKIITNMSETDRLACKNNIIEFNVQRFPSWHLAIKKEDREELLSIGKTTAENWFNLHSSAGTFVSQNKSLDPGTQQTSLPSSKLSLENHGCQLRPPLRDLPQDLPSLHSPPSRRWSV